MPRYTHEIQLKHVRGLEVVEFELPTKKGRHFAKKVRRMVWDRMDKERVLKLLREAYDAGHHAGAMNPYC